MSVAALNPTAPIVVSISSRRIGRIVTALPVLFLLFDTAIKFANIPVVQQTNSQLGYGPELTLPIAIIELACLLVYLVPRTSVFGAVLLTGYLGGAVATHVRVGNPLFGYILFPIYIAILLWGGLYLRDARVRALVKGAL